MVVEPNYRIDEACWTMNFKKQKPLELYRINKSWKANEYYIAHNFHVQILNYTVHSIKWYFIRAMPSFAILLKCFGTVSPQHVAVEPHVHWFAESNTNTFSCWTYGYYSYVNDWCGLLCSAVPIRLSIILQYWIVPIVLSFQRWVYIKMS